jgi:hypothetical protein
MNAPSKPPRPNLPPRPTGEKPDARAAVERIMKRYPKTMARLAE